MSEYQVQRELVRLKLAYQKSTALINRWKRWPEFEKCFDMAARNTPFPFACDNSAALENWFDTLFSKVERTLSAGDIARADDQIIILRSAVTTLNSFCPRLEATLKRQYAKQKAVETRSLLSRENPEVRRRNMKLYELSRQIDQLQDRKAVTQHMRDLNQIDRDLIRLKTLYLDERQSLEVMLGKR